MKALSIYPDPTMEISLGLKTVEYRTWRTDYRGDVLICAGSKRMPGFVNGYAWFVVPLLDIRPAEGGALEDGDRMYDWILGTPRLIEPIRVRGQLFLFDVDDALIRYIPDGDMGPKRGWRPMPSAFAYARRYLQPLAYPAAADGPLWGIYRTLLAPKEEKKDEAPKPIVDLPLRELLEKCMSIDPLPPMTVEYGRKHPELALGLAHHPSQKAGVVKWLQDLDNRGKASSREAYGEKRNLLALLWLAEALGERPAALKKAMSAAMAENSMLQRCEAFRKAIPFDRIKALIDTYPSTRER